MRHPVLWVEFRNSGARLPAVAFVAVGSVLVGSERVAASGWLGRGYDTELYLTVVVATLGGMAACLAGSRLGLELWGRRGAMPRLTARGALESLWPAALAGCLWLTVATVVVSGFAHTRTALLNHSMAVSPLLVLLALVIPVPWYGIGLAVTSIRSSRLLMIALVPWPYLVTLVVGQWGSERALQLAPFIDQRWDPGYVPNDGALAVFVARWVLWTVTAVVGIWAVVPVASSRPRAPRAAFLGGVVATSITLALVTSGPLVSAELATPRPPRQLTCTTSSGEGAACLWPTQLAQERNWHRALTSFDTYRRDLPDGRAVFAVMPPSSRPDLIAIDASASLDPPEKLAGEMEQAYVQRLVQHCYPDQGLSLSTLLHWVALDAPQRLSRPDLRVAWVDAYLREPTALRKQWLARLVATCGA